ncbi:MAG: hypothetical protein HXY22_13285 [Alphaproteobacteria bacterium]|nr:hypothetical protein [Alphaproteobacteria bacterium]
MRIILGVAAAALIAGSAFAEESKDNSAASLLPSDTPNKCAMASQIDRWSYIDDHTIIVETSRSNRFKVTFLNPCHDLDFSYRLALDTRGVGCLSVGDTVLAIPMTVGPKQRCFIKSVEHLAPEKKAEAAPAN